MVKLMKSCVGIDCVISAPKIAPADYQCPVADLPTIFCRTLETILPADAYLKPDPQKVEYFRSKVGTDSHLRVGLAWSGNARHENDHKRSIAARMLAEIIPAGVKAYALQTEFRQGDQWAITPGGPFTWFPEIAGDMSNTAALAQLMDVVVSVDTAVLHLAAALGRPTIGLIPYAPDWRWLLERTDSPWYPTLELIRQPHPGDWPSVMQKLNGRLVGQWSGRAGNAS
jgi:hypothetical protein